MNSLQTRTKTGPLIIPGPDTAWFTNGQKEAVRESPNTLKFSIASTFTSQPVEDTLRFWGKKFGLDTVVRFSPYDQVFQELLDPASSLNQPSQDARVLLLRIDDWVRNLPDTGELSLHTHIVSNIHDLKTFAAMATTFADTPLFVCIARNSKGSRIRPESQIYYEQYIKNELSTYTSIHVTTSEEIDNLYGVEDYYDAQKDQLGHIPFKGAYYTALATSLFRNVLAGKRAPYKVIVLDCDHTLWGGVCGEVPPDQLTLSGGYGYLNAFMLLQKAAGKILCLCSKNVEEDVERVFRERPDLPLRKEDFVTSKINWEPKSRNLKELSKELNLGLDSFIFIDDNPVECAEVRANCPEVVTLNLPEKPEEIGLFLNHAWVFDTLATTGEDKKRTQLYKENIERSGFLESSSSLQEFIDGLNLDIRITEAKAGEIGRVSQLTYRTNQFNFTTIRRSEEQIRELIESDGFTCAVCRVSDRFGEYGLVGAMLYKRVADRILLDSFMLSCRVLGRGVEHRMLRSLGREAVSSGFDTVQIPFVQTEKNRPARNFLKSVLRGVSGTIPTTEIGYLLRSDYLSELAYEPDNQSAGVTPGNGEVKQSASHTPKESHSRIFEQIAKELHHPAKVAGLLNGNSVAPGWTSPGSAASDQDSLAIITGIWERLLGRKGIGPNDHFFDVGGTSLKAVDVLSQLNERFNKNLTIVSLFEHSTIQSLADLVDLDESTIDKFDKIIQRTEARKSRTRRR
ncbi:MAG: HAD-IIIC family phosphatase [Bacteroidota bacterium]